MSCMIMLKQQHGLHNRGLCGKIFYNSEAGIVFPIKSRKTLLFFNLILEKDSLIRKLYTAVFQALEFDTVHYRSQIYFRSIDLYEANSCHHICFW